MSSSNLHKPQGPEDHAEIAQLAQDIYWNYDSGRAQRLAGYCAEHGYLVTEHEAEIAIDAFEESVLHPANDEDEPGKPRPRLGRRLVLTAEEWEKYEVELESNYIIGSPDNPIVRPETKNLIVGPEKVWKTTFGLRLAASMASSTTLFSKLPVPEGRPRKVLYLHGELNRTEMKERIAAAIQGVKTNGLLIQGRDLGAHLVNASGQQVIEEIMDEHKPEIFFIDPWQEFIKGRNENSNEDTDKARDFLNRVIERFHATLFMPMHTGKDVARGPRGHSGTPAWRDTQFTLTRMQTGLRIEVEPRWASPPPAFTLRFQQNTLMEDGTVATWAGRHAEIRRLVEQSAEKQMPKPDLIKRLCDGGATGGAARKAVERAIRDGAVEERGDNVAIPGLYSEKIDLLGWADDD